MFCKHHWIVNENKQVVAGNHGQSEIWTGESPGRSGRVGWMSRQEKLFHMRGAHGGAAAASPLLPQLTDTVACEEIPRHSCPVEAASPCFTVGSAEELYSIHAGRYCLQEQIHDKNMVKGTFWSHNSMYLSCVDGAASPLTSEVWAVYSRLCPPTARTLPKTLQTVFFSGYTNTNGGLGREP